MEKGKVVNIYNLDQCYFYIRNGLNPIFIGKNAYKEKNDIYMKFDMEKSKVLYEEWKNRSNKIE